MSADQNDAGRDNAGRFRAGTPSPNPRGRPRKATDIDAALRGALSKKITVTERGKRRREAKLVVTLDQVVNKSVSGDLRAAKLVLDQARKGEDRAEADAVRTPVMTQTDQEIVALLIVRITEALETQMQGGSDAPEA